jgi:hypothetical protein
MFKQELVEKPELLVRINPVFFQLEKICTVK